MINKYGGIYVDPEHYCEDRKSHRFYHLMKTMCPCWETVDPPRAGHLSFETVRANLQTEKVEAENRLQRIIAKAEKEKKEKKE